VTPRLQKLLTTYPGSTSTISAGRESGSHPATYYAEYHFVYQVTDAFDV
jgi:hypothetical protein